MRLHLWTICYTTSKLAGRLGIEPRFAESKAAVLPLDDLPIIGWPVGNRTLVKRLSSAYSTIELQASEYFRIVVSARILVERVTAPLLAS